tara:strand:+ start:286 stop:507 length:222 start_codon:yes stop_codon:yes gene_type:complete
MDSVSSSQKWLPTVERSPEQVEAININATNYKYNNAFHNPMEVISDEIDFDAIEAHWIDSCPTLNQIIIEKLQ